MTSLRQQSDQVLSVIGSDSIAASSSTVYRHLEKARMKALQQWKSLLSASNSLQLCYDGQIIRSTGTFSWTNTDFNCTKMDEVMESFSKDTSVTGESLFKAISEVCAG